MEDEPDEKNACPNPHFNQSTQKNQVFTYSFKPWSDPSWVTGSKLPQKVNPRPNCFPFNPESQSVTANKIAIRSSVSFNTNPDDYKQPLLIPVKNEVKGTVTQKVILNPARYKTELCGPFKAGLCAFGSECQFAHGLKELRPVKLHNKYKTVKCRSYKSSGFCKHGNNCFFIHEDSQAEKEFAFHKLKMSQEADKQIKSWMAFQPVSWSFVIY